MSTDKLTNLRTTYFKVTGFNSGLKSISSYKVDELLELCKKLDINVTDTNTNKDSKPKKLSKKDIYELLVQKF
jgi:hypothetical protein